MRFCCHCRAEIPREVMIRARWKAIFCGGTACRSADKTLIRAARREYRISKGQCPTCGHRSKAREQAQAVDICMEM